jgi:hypothetical protein
VNVVPSEVEHPPPGCGQHRPPGEIGIPSLLGAVEAVPICLDGKVCLRIREVGSRDDSLVGGYFELSDGTGQIAAVDEPSEPTLQRRLGSEVGGPARPYQGAKDRCAAHTSAPRSCERRAQLIQAYESSM